MPQEAFAKIIEPEFDLISPGMHLLTDITIPLAEYLTSEAESNHTAKAARQSLINRAPY